MVSETAIFSHFSRTTEIVFVFMLNDILQAEHDKSIFQEVRNSAHIFEIFVILYNLPREVRRGPAMILCHWIALNHCQLETFKLKIDIH